MVDRIKSGLSNSPSFPEVTRLTERCLDLIMDSLKCQPADGAAWLSAICTRRSVQHVVPVTGPGIATEQKNMAARQIPYNTAVRLSCDSQVFVMNPDKTRLQRPLMNLHPRTNAATAGQENICYSVKVNRSFVKPCEESTL